jgi:lipid-binding SYLF domain-containing protein
MAEVARIWFTPKQKAELWERWKAGQCVADIARALERRNKNGVQLRQPGTGNKCPARGVLQALAVHWRWKTNVSLSSNGDCSMKKTYLVLPLAAVFCFAQLTASPEALAQSKNRTPVDQRALLSKDVPVTIATYRKTDPDIERFFKESVGYVVFPRIGKVGFIVAGGHGTGEVDEGGKLLGTATITIATVGLQAGGQEFSEIIFFRDRAALDRFKRNKFEFTANVSAVIVTTGAAKGANYRDGIAVFTQPRGGAMVEVALGAQKFSFQAESARQAK